MKTCLLFSDMTYKQARLLIRCCEKIEVAFLSSTWALMHDDSVIKNLFIGYQELIALLLAPKKRADNLTDVFK